MDRPDLRRLCVCVCVDRPDLRLDLLDLLLDLAF